MTKKYDDLTGKHFGKLTVIELSHKKQIIRKNGRKDVNYMKQDLLHNEFLEWVRKIALHNKLTE